jgi:hypothetical protein
MSNRQTMPEPDIEPGSEDLDGSCLDSLLAELEHNATVAVTVSTGQKVPSLWLEDFETTAFGQAISRRILRQDVPRDLHKRVMDAYWNIIALEERLSGSTGILGIVAADQDLEALMAETAQAFRVAAIGLRQYLKGEEG